MKRTIVILSAVALLGCNAREQTAVPSAVPSNSKIAAISQQFEDAWKACLRSSYKSALTQIGDKNLSAERAFVACKSEEDEIVALDFERGIPIAFWLHLKSQTKVVLIEGTL